MTLSPYQRAAVDCDAPRILLRAGAGSGKTKTLTARIQRLVQTWHPKEILALTFTRKAAAEMRERLTGRARRVEVSTFHSWCARTIREWHDLVPIARDFTIRDEWDRDDLLKWIALEIGKSGKKGLERDVWAVKPLHPRTRERLLKDPEVMTRYGDMMREAQALDYDMLETTLLGLLQQPQVLEALRGRYQHVLVDEGQDTSATQQAILDAISPCNLFMVGDHAQSIYAFRGAHVEGFTDLAQTYQDLTLPVNYRSVPAVVETANRCAAAMAVPGLRMEAARESEGGGYPAAVLEMPCRDDLVHAIAESIHIAHAFHEWKDIAVLSPTWDLLDELSEELTTWEIPHEVARKRLDVWESEEARWLLSCARAALNPWDHLALRSALQAFEPRVTSEEWAHWRAAALTAGEAIGDRCLEGPVRDAIRSLLLSGWDGLLDALRALSGDLVRMHLTSRVAGLEALGTAIATWRAANPDTTLQDLLDWHAGRRITDPEVAQDEDRVTLITIHGAKGLEWPAVYVVGLEEGRLPRHYDDEAGREESRRLFYVAVTRARDLLRLCVAGDHEPSRFLGEVGL